MTETAAPIPLAELEARSAGLQSCAAWGRLQAHAAEVASRELRELSAAPDRYRDYSRSAAGLHLDYSRQRLTAETLPLLLQLGEERHLGDWIRHLFEGDDVNNTEGRPALHMALRAGLGAQPTRQDGAALRAHGNDVLPEVRAERSRMLRLADELNSGRYAGHDGRPVTDVVNIGIGGSDLGLVMAVEALRPYRPSGTDAVRLHFVSNIDGTQLADALAVLDPATTLFIVCSKSFTTLETALNADAARRWLLARLPEAALARHFVAISVNDAAMDRFGIAREHRFRIWDWVGGRYSLWSSVGLAIAIAIGSRHFEALLGGAAALDEHFRSAPPAENLPIILGLLGVWNQNLLGVTSHAVLPYTNRLHRFAAFLQQLEMESNGKSVTRDGRRVGWHTGTVVWGEPASSAQHAFFQLLHQGTARFSADFIAPSLRAGGPADQHLAGLANMLAQAEAFARGRSEAEVLGELRAGGMAEAKARKLAPHKVHPGGHASSIVLLEKLDPAGLGALVALYEHKVFVQSVIWGINPFDQWGVELGKVMAQGMAQELTNKLSDAPRGAASATDRLPGIAAEILRAQTNVTDR